MQEETTKRTVRKQQTPYRMYLLALVALVVVAGGGYYGWLRWQAYQNSPEKQEERAKEEKAQIVGDISKFMLMPAGDPVLFRVSNKDQMRAQQAFFKDAENDDVLLVYQESGKAILFRPSSKTIVNVGPVNFDSQTNTRTSTSTKK
jgi:uncharacterized protein HemX